jgi:hypothetical protein
MLRVSLLERYGRAVLKDQFLYDRCITSVRACHEYLGRLVKGGTS